MPHFAAMTLGKRTDYGDAKYAGIALDFTLDVETPLQVRVRRLQRLCSTVSRTYKVTGNLYTPRLAAGTAACCKGCCTQIFH